MSDNKPSRMQIQNPRRKGVRSLSLVWLVPVVALLASLGLAVQSYLESDVPIVIEFPDASGIEAGKTHLRFRNVVVGSVSSVEFAPDLNHVEVTVNVRRDMVSYLDEGAKFWLVQAEVTAQGISGLDTLLSGAYINADWDADPGDPQNRFTAESKAPIVAPGTEGLEVVLTSTDSGSVSVGAPILYKGVEVGEVEDVSLSESGGLIEITAFVEAPHNELINTGTRFWNASGIGVEIDDEGLKVNVESLSALLRGGVAFDTFTSGGEIVRKKSQFDLFPDQVAAKDSRFDDDLRATVTVASSFEGSLKGLKEGAVVDYRGLKVGEVKELSVYAPGDAALDVESELLVTYTIQPNRLGITGVTNPDEVLEFLAEDIRTNGLRARLKPNSLLSGGLHVELFEDPSLPAASLQRTGYPVPLLPAVPTPPDTLRIAAEGVLDRVAKLPVEELLDRTIRLIADLDAIVADQNTKEIPGSVNMLLGNVNTVVASDATQQLPEQLNSVLSSIDAMLSEFEQRDGVKLLADSLGNLRTTTANLSTASDGVPDLIAEIDAVVAKIDALPIETTIETTNNLLASAESFISSDAMENVPGALSGALEQVRDTLKDLREGGATENLNKALASAGSAADELAKAAASLPELAQRLESLADTAEATIGAYGPSSPVNREVQAAIGDIRRTVQSLNTLVQALRRNPNSLIVGR